MAFSLPALPYGKDALAPHINAKTLDFHYDKHHQTYLTNLNKLLQGNALEDEDLASIIQKSAGKADMVGIFNNAAQVWNHTFYWHSMKPGGGGKPTGPIAQKIDADFGGYDKFVEEFKAAGLSQFGSGWAWLVLKDGKLQISKSGNADTPMAHGMKALLTVDVWEHAYYLDYQNRRGDYLDVVIAHLINWDFVNSILG